MSEELSPLNETEQARCEKEFANPQLNLTILGKNKKGHIHYIYKPKIYGGPIAIDAKVIDKKDLD